MFLIQQWMNAIFIHKTMVFRLKRNQKQGVTIKKWNLVLFQMKPEITHIWTLPTELKYEISCVFFWSLFAKYYVSTCMNPVYKHNHETLWSRANVTSVNVITKLLITNIWNIYTNQLQLHIEGFLIIYYDVIYNA